jgi:aspartate/methionine/tyrosine aminotransferase
MESRLAAAARVAAIEPFRVMEVQTAARALEAAGRSVVHMEIGEPDFPTPAPVLAAAQAALADGGIHYTWEFRRCARRSRGTMPNASR